VDGVLRTNTFFIDSSSFKSLYALHGGHQDAWATLSQPTTPQVYLYNPIEGKRCGEISQLKMFNPNLLYQLEMHITCSFMFKIHVLVKHFVLRDFSRSSMYVQMPSGIYAY